MEILPLKNQTLPQTEADTLRKEISALNQRLLDIEKKIYNTDKNVDIKSRITTNSHALGLLNSVEVILKRYSASDTVPMEKKRFKTLQILLIKCSMGAIYSGDTDWQSYGLSQEIYQNTKKFILSGEYMLSKNDEEHQKISIEDFNLSYKCCQYNFAHSIAYNDIHETGIFDNTELRCEVDKLADLLGQNVAFAIVNAHHALRICIDSLSESNLLKDDLYNTLFALNIFYDHYKLIKCTGDNDITSMQGAAQQLSNQGVFFPLEVIHELFKQ